MRRPYGEDFVEFAHEHGWQAVVTKGRWKRPDSVTLYAIEEETAQIVRISDVPAGSFTSIDAARAWIFAQEERDVTA